MADCFGSGTGLMIEVIDQVGEILPLFVGQFDGFLIVFKMKDEWMSAQSGFYFSEFIFIFRLVSEGEADATDEGIPRKSEVWLEAGISCDLRCGDTKGAKHCLHIVGPSQSEVLENAIIFFGGRVESED